MFVTIESILAVLHLCFGVLLPGIYLNFYARSRYNESGLRQRVSAWMWASWAIFLMASLVNGAVTLLNPGLSWPIGIAALIIATLALGIPGAIFVRQALAAWQAGKFTASSPSSKGNDANT